MTIVKLPWPYTVGPKIVTVMFRLCGCVLLKMRGLCQRTKPVSRIS